ncbi:hypothetical protein GVN21_19510 [Caulobacter sp. SLTY]|uniref:hypothetical protein n=1 Tax=Caulobacter sp. SLTY TaxID=2683262 RepID=UPI001412F986|nr:hypothetical protein [Caulobacter sp. SLTY]NBB17555.1 hypothetical protein [Caulobacter sp. SLTY]
MRETFKLETPVDIVLRGTDGKERTETVSAIEFDFPDDGKLRAKHLRATDRAEGLVGKTLALAELFGDQPMKVLDELEERDMMRLYEVVEGFRKPGRQTGETA